MNDALTYLPLTANVRTLLHQFYRCPDENSSTWQYPITKGHRCISMHRNARAAAHFMFI
ncbi:hypothetical protein PILCRDRAFT_822606 [Piloderma croceum F 1598]|uniref:Uncharacterized protein n=1 Tax=Piloderma croceum (strain F 1598) TaxID=765440 RepID=A0A0C3FLU4_PILCF|nr:hypothetical protein PILCRDRAFT_822606 [Piloderma croceum F 1598]